MQFNKVPRKMGFGSAQPSLVQPRWLSEVVGIVSLLRENQNLQISRMLFPHESCVTF